MIQGSAVAGSAPATAGGGSFTGTWGLVRFMLRRDRVRLTAWAGGFALLVAYLVVGIPAAYGTEEELGAIAQIFADPVGRLLVGPAYGITDPTYESLIANGYGLYFLIMSVLMSFLLVVRHTRLEEQTGRAELVRANVVGRHASLSAAMIVAVVNNAVVAVVIVAAMMAAGFGAEGSMLFGASVAAGGLAFAGVAALTAQLSAFSRAAAGMAGAVLGIAFVIRAGGDMAAEGGTTLSWFSPLAWSQQTAPFVLDRWWPLALSLGFAAVMTVAGFAVSTRRDVGASLIAVRRGSPEAAGWLRSPLALAVRLQRSSTLWWTLALTVSGLLFGAFTETMLSAFEELPPVFIELFGGAEELVAGYLGYMALYMAWIAGAYAVLSVVGLRGEETSGRLEPVLATPVSRWVWLGGNIVVSAVGAVIVLGVTGVSTGVGAAVVTGDDTLIADLTVAHLNQVPPVLVVLGVAALLFGVFPRAIGLAWVLVGYGLFAGTFGQLLDLPAWALDLSPYAHPARMPLESFEGAPVVVLIVVAVAASFVGLLGFRRRGIESV
ncbi:MAG: ABC transporter permease [Coriobacteriia bacterium]|nr:ABC transporter permease [Coriobacteriia bacterium]